MWSGDIYYKGLSSGSIPASGFVGGENSGVPRCIPFKEKFPQMEIESLWFFVGFFFFFFADYKINTCGQYREIGRIESTHFHQTEQFLLFWCVIFSEISSRHAHIYIHILFLNPPPTMLFLIISHLLYSSLQLLRSRALMVMWLTR